MIIYGKNPVKELFSGPVRKIEELFVLEKSADSGSAGLVKLAKENGVKVSFLPRDGLTRIADSPNHQGLAARITDFQYSNVDDIMEAASEKGEKLLLIILDHIEDPQNPGAIIRTADVLGAHGAVIPKDRSASVTPAVLKASAGAAHHLPVSRVVNIASQIRN